MLGRAKEIISLMEQYFSGIENCNENWTGDFGYWLQNSLDDEEKIDEHSGGGYSDILIGMQLVKTSNMMRAKLNRFVSDSPFATFLDYQFLYVLNEHSQMTKSELIFAHSMEMSSGIEVVRRLLKQNWIGEKKNPRDRRSKLIMVTESGKKILDQYGDSARAIYTSFSRGFDESRKRQILQVLTLLNSSYVSI